MARPRIPITGDGEADRLLVTEPLALLIGMLLDQQVPMEWAFRGPATLKERLGGTLDARQIAAMDPEDFVAICALKPAIHRYPASMGRRIWELCGHVVDHYDGDAAKLWFRVRNAEEIYRRLRQVPGYGEEKSKIFVAILAKRLGKTPDGWQAVCDPFGDNQPRSVADVADADSLAEVRSWKSARKAERKAQQAAAQPS